MTDGKPKPGPVDDDNKQAADGDAEAATDASPAQRRLKGFGTHLVVYFLAMVVIVPLNFWLAPTELWFVLPMVGWGSVLSVHAAYAMGLFGAFCGGSR